MIGAARAALLWSLLGLVLVPVVQAEAEPFPGWLGLGWRYHEDTGAGGERSGWFLVHGVAPGGPAERAGLAAQDVIVEIDGEPFTFDDDLEALDAFARIRPGDEVHFTVRRQEKSLEVKERAVEMPQELREVWRRNYDLARRRAAGDGG